MSHMHQVFPPDMLTIARSVVTVLLAVEVGEHLGIFQGIPSKIARR